MREESRLEECLEAVADAQDELAIFDEAPRFLVKASPGGEGAVYIDTTVEDLREAWQCPLRTS